MAPGASTGKLTARQEKAAVLVAQDKMSDKNIAHECGIGRATLSRWKLEPEFAARVRQHQVAVQARIERVAIAQQENRLKRLNHRWDLIHQVIEERGKDPNMQEVPGGKTGLLIRHLKQLGSGLSAMTVEEFEPDTALLKAASEHERQAAEELGQWQAPETGGDDGSHTMEELLILYRRATTRARNGAPLRRVDEQRNVSRSQ